MSEFEKLVKMMDEARIPYERDDDATDFADYYRNYFCSGIEPIKRIKYPKIGTDEVCSVIYGPGTYGYPEGLLEIMGLLTDEEAKYDDVVGHLTAEDVFSRIKADYETRMEEKRITLEETIKVIEGMKRGIFPWYSEKYFDVAIKALKQKTGRWINDREVVDKSRKPTTYHFETHCSECGFKYAYTTDIKDSIPTNYCPNCGAKMEEMEDK